MYHIQQFYFSIDNPDHIPLPTNLNQFYVTDTPKQWYTYRLSIVEDITVDELSFTYQKEDFKVISENGFEKRYLYIKNSNQPYACCQEISPSESIIHIHRLYVSLMSLDTMFISLLSLERHQAHLNHFILHCSYITINQQAILFTAPSGTGKSTQASLWEKYTASQTINGDRALLVKKENQFYACGWPICGSSEICLNQSYPIACIVVLSQGKENEIVELSYKDAFKRLLSETTINYYNTDYTLKALDFIEDLAKSVKIYHLSCTISQEAVTCLEKRMKEDQLWML